MERHTTPADEAEKIIRTLAQTTSEALDGKTAIRQMDNEPDIPESDWNGGAHTWAGAHFENYSIKTLIDHIGGNDGPNFGGGSEIDYERDFLWDFKAIAARKSSGRKKYQHKLNNQETIMNAIAKDGALGFIIMRHNPRYEENPEGITNWYRRFKGKKEYPTEEREAPYYTGQRSRQALRIDGYFIDGYSELREAIDEGWVKHRVNSNGKEEYYLHFDNAEESGAVLFSHEF